ncbi:MAG TPA: hypothetical protein VK433_05675 [Stellaceae bacterium]|nr:hypothetical protein [Stellaceae bacterium]
MQRRMVRIVLCMVAATVVLPALLVLAVDPYQVLHSPFLRPALFINNDRYQDAGLIHQYLGRGDEYDGIVIGTSMSEGYAPAETGAVLGGRNALGLTIRGGNADALALVAKSALATGKVRHVLWEVYRGYWDPLWMEQSQMPVDLYSDDTRWGFRHYLFNHDAVISSTRILRGTQAGVPNIEMLYMTSSEFAVASREFNSPANLEKLRAELVPGAPIVGYDRPANAPQIEHAILDDLFAVIDAHPEATYDIVFPPTSYMDIARRGPMDFAQRALVLRLLTTEAAKRPNVTIFGFDTLSCVGGDLRNYRDYNHFSPGVRDVIVSSLRSGSNRITAADLDAYLAEQGRDVAEWRDRFLAGGPGYDGRPLACAEATN